MKLLILLLLISVTFILKGQTFNGLGDTIPDDGSTSIDFTINVSGIQNTTNANFGISTICLNINHTYDSDLNCWLVSPSGISVPLIQSIGGDGDNFTSTCLNMSSSNSIQTQNAPFTGTFKPVGNLGNLNDGSDPNGNWILRIYDNYTQDQGVLIDWNITFDNNPPIPTPPFTTSELAIFKINTKIKRHLVIYTLFHF
jgi:subtilisin-like proprotein convertase family protein